MLQNLVLIGHVLIAIFIVVLVLLQRGKGAETGAAFGAGSSGTVFGARGSANFLSRGTAVLAAMFFLSSLTLAFYSGQVQQEPGSLMERSAPGGEVPGDAVLTPLDEDDADFSELPELEDEFDDLFDEDDAPNLD